MPGKKKSRKMGKSEPLVEPSPAETVAVTDSQPSQTENAAATVSPEKKPGKNKIFAIVYVKSADYDTSTFDSKAERDAHFKNLPTFLVSLYGIEKHDFDSFSAMNSFLDDVAEKIPDLEELEEPTAPIDD